MDHPPHCGVSLDLRVPHPSHRCASLLEVSSQAAAAGREGAGLRGSTLPWAASQGSPHLVKEGSCGASRVTTWVVWRVTTWGLYGGQGTYDELLGSLPGNWGGPGSNSCPANCWFQTPFTL